MIKKRHETSSFSKRTEQYAESQRNTAKEFGQHPSAKYLKGSLFCWYSKRGFTRLHVKGIRGDSLQVSRYMVISYTLPPLCPSPEAHAWTLIFLPGGKHSSHPVAAWKCINCELLKLAGDTIIDS
eukprot:g71780.t1